MSQDHTIDPAVGMIEEMRARLAPGAPRLTTEKIKGILASLVDIVSEVKKQNAWLVCRHVGCEEHP